MENYFASLDDEELSQLLNDFRKKSEDKRAERCPVDNDEIGEGYRMMAGNLRDGSIQRYNYKRDVGGYNNIVFPMWKSFAPSHGGSKQVCPIARELIPSRKPLAESVQALFRYRIEKFDYVGLTTACGMDAFFSVGGVGYARHEWDESKGITTTSRFDPKNVYWDSNAGSVKNAKHVIERHKISRGEFIKKFDAEKGWKADACEGGTVNWPKRRSDHDGKSPLDQIEYFLCWSKEGGYKRVYAFTKKQQDGILNEQDGEPGEEWPIDLADDDWHLTELVFTPVPGQIDGISTYWAARDQFVTYQRLNTACFFAGLKSAKTAVFVPEVLKTAFSAVEKTGSSLTIVGYLDADIRGEIDKMLVKWDMPPVSEQLMAMRAEAEANWRNITGVNAVSMMDSANLETATEAQTLRDSAQNNIAADQGAVERFWSEIWRKELICDLSRMPKRSVVCWKPAGTKEEPEGEFEDEPDSDDYAKGQEEYIPDVPYQDALLLEKGPVSMAAARSVAKSRQAAGDKTAQQLVLQGVVGPQLEQAKQQAVDQVPQTPEMAIRLQYQVPMDAVCTIVNPGVEQFIGTEAAAGWEEGLPARQIESELMVSVERGSSSATDRMQAVNEVLMLFNALVPVLQQLGCYEQIAELINAAIKKSEIGDLDRARVTLEQIQQSLQQQQQAAQQAAQAEAQAKAQASQGPQELNPNDALKAEAEVHKSNVGLESQKQKTEQQKLKIVGEQVKGDFARDRTRSEAQLQMGGIGP